ncbi:MAG: sulfur carrier protein ThiS [Clostridiales bacterium]|nr:sulfur carrier protein ThiS [Clostridiales bacterium]
MIRVNQRDMDFREGMTVKNLLEDLKYSFPNLIVRINGEYIPRESYEKTVIKDNDDISIIHPIAGG